MNIIIKSAVLAFLALLFTGSGAMAELEVHTGMLMQIERAGKYTYMKLDENGKEVWIAALPMQAPIGAKIEYKGGVPMKNFESKGLNRTFESILFVTLVRIAEGSPEGDKHKVLQSEPAEGEKEKNKAVPVPETGEIEKAEGGKTVGEIFLEREQLKDKEVVLRGKVMKVSTNIMGKNWITLSDGTGAAPDNKIIATSAELVDPGDIVIVKGIVENNVNLGSGYQYKVLIGNAEFKK